MTTENSRADALTDLLPCPFCNGTSEFDSDDSGYHWVACRSCGVSSDTARHCDDDCRERLTAAWNTRATPPVSQPAAAPIDPPRYTQADMECYGKAYADARDARRTAPSPADERAALSDQDIYDKFSFLEGLVNESTYVEIADTAIDIARAASANETGRKRWAIAAGWKLVPVDPTPEILMAIWQNERDARCAWERALAAAPQPAQADARVGLTDGRIARLRAAIEGECDGLCVDYHHAKAILAYLDDDRA